MSIRYASLSNTAQQRTLRAQRRQLWYANAGNTFVGLASFVNVATASSSSSKGAWAQVFSSTAANITHIYISNLTTNWASNDGSMLLDIGIGASGSETAIMSNVALGGYASALSFPIAIPAGSRVAARVQGLRTSYSQYINFAASATSDYSRFPSSIDAIGVNTSTLKGVALSGASGTYTEITSATAKDYEQFVIIPSCNSTTNGGLNGTLTLAYGSAGSEVDVGSVGIASNTSQNNVSLSNTVSVLNGRFAPAGTRLSIKHNLSSTSGYAVSLIGIPYA
jgi:hypothetical protein